MSRMSRKIRHETKTPLDYRAKTITFSVCFNRDNYDRERLSGLYKLLQENESLTMQKGAVYKEDGSLNYDCIYFTLQAPENKIDSLYTTVINHIQFPYTDEIERELLRTGIVPDVIRHHIKPFLHIEPPEIIMTRTSSPRTIRTRSNKHKGRTLSKKEMQKRQQVPNINFSFTRTRRSKSKKSKCRSRSR